MTNEERIERFRNGKIAVNCETEEEAKCFIDWCYTNGLEWSYSTSYETYFKIYEDRTCYDFNFLDCDRTCYDFNFLDCGHLGYGSKHFYEEKGHEVIKYKDFMGVKKITNLEYVTSKGLVEDGNTLCYTAHVCKYGVDCMEKECDCYECEFSNNIDLCVKALVKEHKEPIKLKQWEYDLIETNDKSRDYRFDDFKTYQYMLGKGHFKGVYDKTMTLREILDNCEIVADDYDFGE